MVREGKQVAPARPTIEEAIGILMKNPHAVFQNATETLFQVVKNLISHPDEPMYRALKRSSNAFSSKLAPAVGAVRFLRAIGFVEQGSSDAAADGVFTIEKPDATLLAAGKAALKEAVKEYRRLEEAARTAENAAAAQRLAELRELSKQNQAKQNAEAQAERERIMEIARIDKWEKERQKDPNCVL